MRPIDADALIADIISLWDRDTIDGITAKTVLKQTITDIGNMPTIDAVPVVRCGNCAKRGKNGKGIPGGCPFGMTDDTCDPNAYCSYGVLSMKVEQRWTEKGKSRK